MTSITYNFLNLFGLTTDCQINFNAIHPKNKDGRALTSCKVKVYAQTLFSWIPFSSFVPWLTRREIGTFTTDAIDGSFSHKYSVIQLPFQKQHHLQFEFYEESRASCSIISNSSKDTLVSTHFTSASTGKTDIKDIEVELYEFEDQFPQYEVPKKAANLSDQWNSVDYARIIKASAAGKIKDFFIGLFAKIYPNITNDQIEGLQGIKDRKICQETTLDLLLNGIEPSFKKDRFDNYMCEINWDGCELKKDEDLLNVNLFAVKNNEGKLEIEKIIFQKRGSTDRIKYIPTDENFKTGLYEFNRLALVHGSLAHHLGVH
ncbi:MAG TPA: hypothetical protein PLC42_03565, partial [Parachlamydiaceae bacterium]|nr:hypothetical protein [Parachlamydiaceae bacterium]